MDVTPVTKTANEHLNEVLASKLLPKGDDGKINLQDITNHMVQVVTSYGTYQGGIERGEGEGWWNVYALQPVGPGQVVPMKIMVRAEDIRALAFPFKVEKPLVEVAPAGAVPTNGKLPGVKR